MEGRSFRVQEQLKQWYMRLALAAGRLMVLYGVQMLFWDYGSEVVDRSLVTLAGVRSRLSLQWGHDDKAVESAL